MEHDNSPEDITVRVSDRDSRDELSKIRGTSSRDVAVKIKRVMDEKFGRACKIMRTSRDAVAIENSSDYGLFVDVISDESTLDIDELFETIAEEFSLSISRDE